MFTCPFSECIGGYCVTKTKNRNYDNDVRTPDGWFQPFSTYMKQNLSVALGIMILNRMQNRTCLKPPTSNYIWDTSTQGEGDSF